MTEPTSRPQGTDGAAEPVLQPARRLNPSLIWLVPVVAALAGLVLVLRAVLSSGPTVTISFKSAEGLEPGKTEVKYKEVVIGRVREISLTDDLQGVVAAVELTREASDFAVYDTRFWVVRPRIDTGGVSGLNTLLSGAYIGVDIGQSNERRRDFEGLEVPPAVTSDRQGRRFILKALDQGSLDIGSPVYYRRIPVGRVVGTKLDDDGRGVTVQIFVDAPYDRFVSEDARFWNASGIDVRVGAAGLKINTQSLASVLIGGVAFGRSGRDEQGSQPAAANTAFLLHGDEASALAPPDGEPMRISMRFEESLRGLAAGAAVEFRGIELGTVDSVRLDYDERRAVFSGTVLATIYPQRLGDAYETLSRGSEGETSQTAPAVFNRLVQDGLRAQLRTGNLLTGQLYVALDLLPKAKPAGSPISVEPFEIPTERGSLAMLQTQIADIVRKLDEVPFGAIGRNTRDALASADKLLKQLDADLAPEAKRTLQEAQRTLDSATRTLGQDGGLPQDASRALSELERAARALRGLADYLQRHPQALIFGGPQPAPLDASPVVPPPAQDDSTLQEPMP
ncbi:MAG TPA: MlaD family protein [Solimonas sp.]